jgi:hypothetical protein
MKSTEEFYVGYGNGPGPKSRKKLRTFLVVAIVILVTTAFAFISNQSPSVNSRFDFANETELRGTFYQQPYPLMRVQLANGIAKDIILLGFGKSGAWPYLKNVIGREGILDGKALSITGNLIYYNGKTLLQINKEQDVRPLNIIPAKAEAKSEETQMEIQGEIIDPKCYFGVMKPGFGKIHRSCAALCISGGIPPVLVAMEQGVESYYLLTDEHGKAIHRAITPYLAQQVKLIGKTYQQGGWNYLSVKLSNISILGEESDFFSKEI